MVFWLIVTGAMMIKMMKSIQRELKVSISVNGEVDFEVLRIVAFPASHPPKQEFPSTRDQTY
jgi:hypothetical protein